MITAVAPTRELAVMAALVEPSKRAIMQQLTAGPASASRLAERIPLTRQALVKHLAALEGAGLVERQRSGREHVFSAQPEAVVGTARWLESLADSWQRQLGALKRAAEAEAR